MELIVGSSVPIQIERRGQTVGDVFDRLAGYELAISAVTLVELAHGISRAKDESIRRRRERFVDVVRASLTVVPLGEEIAVRAGLLNGELASRGQLIGVADSIIAATALMRGDGVATLNTRHFRPMAGLTVVEW